MIRRTLGFPHRAPKATGEFLSEAAPSTQFLPTFPTAFHLYPLETAPHSLNCPSREKKKVKRRRRRGSRALTHFVMPFDHTFIYKTDGCPTSCLYQCMFFSEKRGPEIGFNIYLESEISKKKTSPILSSALKKKSLMAFHHPWYPCLQWSALFRKTIFLLLWKENLLSLFNYCCVKQMLLGNAMIGISVRPEVRRGFGGNMRYRQGFNNTVKIQCRVRTLKGWPGFIFQSFREF